MHLVVPLSNPEWSFVRMMLLCGVLNLSSSSSRSIISNCVRAFVQPPSYSLSVYTSPSPSSEFYVGICNELLEFCLMHLAIVCLASIVTGVVTVVCWKKSCSLLSSAHVGRSMQMGTSLWASDRRAFPPPLAFALLWQVLAQQPHPLEFPTIPISQTQ